MITPNLSRILRHDKVAFCFSGGKDSTAVLVMLREAGFLDRVCVYHLDTGDLLPEITRHVDDMTRGLQNFVRISTNALRWQEENGLPSDLVPYTQHAIGRAIGQGRGVRLVGRYECCWANLMLPVWERVLADGNTLIIRGTKSVDMPRLPVKTGDTSHGMEMFYPIEDWTHEEVFSFLAEKGIALPPIYGSVTNAPECARCPAWWGEARGEYLAKNYPDLHKEYAEKLAVVVNEIGVAAAPLQREMKSCGLI